MKKFFAFLRRGMDSIWNWLSKHGFGMRIKLILIFLLAKVLPLILVTIIAWTQIVSLGNNLRDIAVLDSSQALNDSAIENIERMTTDTAQAVAQFLYARDDDIRYLAALEPTEENYGAFIDSQAQALVKSGTWELSEDGSQWVQVEPQQTFPGTGGGVSTNGENNDQDGFHYRPSNNFEYERVLLYDEITFVDLSGMEQVKVVRPSTRKLHYPLSPEKRDVSKPENTYVKAETYFEALQAMQPGDIYVSDVIGAYTPSNYIGMYVPERVAYAESQRHYDIPYQPEAQAYAGAENPNGQRFEGIIRWATPVAGADGKVRGYVTFALSHDHIMEFVDHQTPMNERYTQLPSAFDGNYAFIWDYQCRSICHPRHHSIVGFNPETGERAVPWLDEDLYTDWQKSGIRYWYDYITKAEVPSFHEQSRKKIPATVLTRKGMVGLDGRYLNNAPQCTGWMDLSKDGGSGSFYILWSGLYKLTTAAAIPYYTGQYAPSEANGYSRRGFGVVTIGAGLEDFTRPATETGIKLEEAIGSNLNTTFIQLFATTAGIVVLVVLIAIWLASWLTGNITRLIQGISRFRAGERQFRFDDPVKDEFGTLADSFDDMADSVVASVTNPLSIIGMDRRILYMNQQGLTMIGKTLEEVVGTLYGDSSLYPAGTEYDPILAMEEGREAEIYHDPDSGRYVRGSASYQLNKEGRRIGYQVETIDMTEVVQEQMAIEEQRTLLNQIFTASPDMIWYTDEKGHYLAVNPRFASIVGADPATFIGRTGAEVLPEYLARSFYENDRRALQSGAPFYTEERVTFADGHQEVLDSVRTPVLEAGGKGMGLLGFARNVDVRVNMESQLRHTQQELEQAVNDANAANKHKGDFLARMSHEIRTPMNAIIGIADIVGRKLKADTPTPQEMGELRAYVEQIETSSQHLLGLLNDILDISKIEAGKIELTSEVLDLPKLVETVAGIIRPRCSEKSIAFHTRLDSFSPATFQSDPLRLRQVLINLLGNAVKFTPEGGTIAFSVEKLNQEKGRTLVGFSVKDTGIGIAKEKQSTIFEAFEQGGVNITGQFGGTGLGLAISNRIVQLFGGEIQLESEPGHGSQFSFSLWLQETDAPQEEALPVEVVDGLFAGKRLLLVDDVELNRVIIRAMLETTGILIDEAADGQQAIDQFVASAPGTYDIILMDVQMPGMDGYQASQTIRALPREDAAAVVIVAVTANAFQEDIQRALESGMNAHLAKPVEMDTLLQTLGRYLEVQG